MQIDQQKIRSWVQLFLKHVAEVGEAYHVQDEEGYKFEAVEHFQKHFDLEADDLVNMLDEAILNTNLVAGSMYFPKKMLLIFAEEHQAEVRTILQRLFDESLLVQDRLAEAESAFDDLMAMRNKTLGEEAHSYVNLRFLSLLLGLRYPEKYNPLKPSEWRVFAKYIDDSFKMPIRLTAGEQYEVYQPYIEALREHIDGNEAVQALKKRLTQHLSFDDAASRWMTQNVIYVGARVYAKRAAEAAEAVPARTDEEDVVGEGMETNTGFFAYENHLEEYIIKNWDRINFGEELRIYIDEGGSEGQQYTTDVGIIDILAIDKDDDFVVIELKRAESGYKVVGQVLNYMGWVSEKLAEPDGKKVRGMIVVGKADKTLKAALSQVADKVALKEYRTQVDIVDPS
ncbi:DUF1016 family protein [Candidatus Kaiserbacteria bacterium]|nr:DUF1016 family protein [Candidatus Kaiserbacteria bacterium]MCB9812221.1 DUF1016 family protein [Candidatus Nomurabacteria bacterium]